MEKCHPLQEGLARPERCASLPLHPQLRSPSGIPPHPPPDWAAAPCPASGSGDRAGSRPGALGWVPCSLRTGPGRPSGEPQQIPPGFLCPRSFGGMAGAGGSSRPSEHRVGPRVEGANAAHGRANRAGGAQLLALLCGAGHQPELWGEIGAPSLAVQRPRARLPGWGRGPEAAPAARPAGTVGDRTGQSVPPLRAPSLVPFWGPSSPSGGLIQFHKAAQPLPSLGQKRGTPGEMQDVFRVSSCGLYAWRMDKLQLLFFPKPRAQ